MASPFRVFRRYQKTLLVVAGVILMFVFVIGDSLVAYLSGSPRGSSESSRDARAVAVTWDTGRLTNQELDQLMMRRRIVSSFLRTVHDEGVRSALMAGIEPRELRVQPLQALISQPTEQGVVATMLFAEAARESGIRVSDDAIVSYLHELGRHRVSGEDMRAMLNQAGGGRIPAQYMMDALREELLAHSYLASYQFAFHTVTPQQGYADWLRVNDRVVVEAAAVPVESFTVDVPEPTDAELRAFFEEPREGGIVLKEREPQPDLIGQMELPSPVPGFRIPRKIDVQFIQAEYDQFLTKVENEITEEEIAKYYEENKDPLFIKAETGLFDAPDARETTTAEESPAGGETEAPATQPETEEQPSDSTTPSAETSDASANNASADTESELETNPDATEPAPGSAAPAGDDQTSGRGNPRHGVFRLAAFAQEQEQEPAAESAQAGAAAPATGESQAETSASTAEEAATDEKPIEFQPLDEVRDEIRTRLARDRVNERLTSLMGQLQSQVNGEFTSYVGARLDAESQGRRPPAPPAALTDLAPLAVQHGLKHGRTGPISWLELRETPVGASGDIETNRELFRILFATDDLDLYQPISTQDLDGNRYLAMKTSDTPGRIPSLAEKRNEVVRAWKLEKAAERALKYAEDLAKKAQEAGKPLVDVFADNQSLEVVRTDPFSRYTGGTVSQNLQGQFERQPFRLSEPDGITAAGPDFMDEVFSLKDDEVGAVLNHDHSMVYVVRVAERMMSTDALRDAYLTEAGNWPGIGMMINDHARIASSLLVSDMVANRNLKWERPPDQEPVDEEAEAEAANDE